MSSITFTLHVKLARYCIIKKPCISCINKIFLLASSIIFIIFSLLMKSSSDILNASVYNILHYEFLFSFNRYQMIMNAWSIEEINAAIINTWLDFGWLVGYGGLVITLNTLLSEFVENTRKKLIQFAALSGFFAMVFDIFENILLLNLLYETRFVFSYMPLIVSIIATIKFMFVGYGIAAFFAVLIEKIIKITKRKHLKIIFHILCWKARR